MAKSLFSVPIFFIVFRETLEAAIIVSVLLGLVEQLVFKDSLSPAPEGSDTGSKSASPPQSRLGTGLVEDDTVLRRRLLRKMRIQVRYLSAFRLQYILNAPQIFVGSAIGLLIALSIGAASVPPLPRHPWLAIAQTCPRFIAVWFTKASDLWSKSEELWEGSLIIITPLYVLDLSPWKGSSTWSPPSWFLSWVSPSWKWTEVSVHPTGHFMLLTRLSAKVKWKVKLSKAFNDGSKFSFSLVAPIKNECVYIDVDQETKTGQWVLLFLPLITVMREGISEQSLLLFLYLQLPSRSRGSRFRRRSIPRPTRNRNSDRHHRRYHLWSRLRIPHLRIRQ